ncbi:hypothetical protein B0I35DRAFT_446761 [Stachybotrys elegans]|uniref:Uncharacterized protein n=1 Tax=Stachybotrys elegans TaxID=80388 RepID=A0A8K0SBN7_9HYPO|nr:hypothetical protein B0I35DRAFT_446761 [Stachybotrys elegans]
MRNSQSPNAASNGWVEKLVVCCWVNSVISCVLVLLYLNEGSTYTTYTQVSDRPRCSFDYGSNGYTASCNLGGELLRFTTPSDNTGLISATAQVDESLGSRVALAESYKGNKSTFGLKFLSISSDTERKTKPMGKKDKYVLGTLVERGAISNRWPLHEYAHGNRHLRSFFPLYRILFCIR